MGDLTPIAFDIETNGFDPESVITVAGLAHELGEVLILNTDGQQVDSAHLEPTLQARSGEHLELTICPGEPELLQALRDIATNRLDGDQHYLTAFNGETWNGGFDLPFLRTACVSHNIEWPFPDMAYADMFSTSQSSVLTTAPQTNVSRSSVVEEVRLLECEQTATASRQCNSRRPAS